jgi:hypothetical protein
VSQSHYLAYLEAETERMEARIAAAKAERERLLAKKAELEAESARLEAEIKRASTPWLSDWPFLRSFLLLGLPFIVGFFVREENRSWDWGKAPTGLAIMVGITLMTGLAFELIQRHLDRQS